MATAVKERNSGVQGLGSAAFCPPPAALSCGAPTATNVFMLPRCKIEAEKCKGGLKINCCCDDPIACNMLQNLCKMLEGGLCGCSCLQNGICVCTCSFAMGSCKCENTEEGVCISCTSGDAKCCEILQACCDCLCRCLDAGCTCCITINNTPICCGCCA